MTREQLGILLKKFLSGNASSSEKQLLDDWYNQYNEELEVGLSDSSINSEELLDEKIYARLRTAIQPVSKKRISVAYLWKRAAIAASVLIILSLAAWFYFKPVKTQNSVNIAGRSEITPGTDRAVLVKGDGTRIDLDNANDQQFSEANGTLIKSSNGELLYSNSTNSIVLYNSLEVPLKGMYRIILADGTKVWLNSLSSLYFPTSFPGKERRVKITGEAYFEIAKNASKPFIVEVEGEQEIEVLGTHFNVNAYNNEKIIKTTLIEGSIRVNANGEKKILVPGEESLNDKSGKLSTRKNVNIESVLAWKNGLFICDGMDLKTILRQVARWYDVEVVYEGEIAPDTFIGEIPRTVNLSDLLKVLEITGVKFRLEGRTIIVMP